MNFIKGALIAFCFSSTMMSIYRLDTIANQANFAETFDMYPLDRKWVLSQSLKDGGLDICKYDGEWLLEEPKNKASPGNKGLVLKSPGHHHAISAYLSTVHNFQDKPLVLQYEVFFQNGIDCGGGYIKLLSHSDDLRLSQFSDATPYSIMFGPDKCGSIYKIHFIFRHRNPLTGMYEEKHARQPDTDLSDYFTDHMLHLYTLNLYTNNTFEILIDQILINNGSLLEDMDPSVMLPREIEDQGDTKPFNWYDRSHIPDPSVMKPDGWNEEAPHLITDATAQKPTSWLEEEDPFVPDSEAQSPHDWTVEMAGEWEAPLIANPACATAAGCGPWKPPMLPNPAYKGKWKSDLWKRRNGKGKWCPQMIPNQADIEDPHSIRMSPASAVGFELWSLTGDVLFDNILVCDDLVMARQWTEDTWGKMQTSGVVEQLLFATGKCPWLWGVYVFTMGLPVILFISFMWPDTRFGPLDQDYYYKKCDEPQPDSPQDEESTTSFTDNGPKNLTGLRKRETNKAQKKSDLELKSFK